MSVRASARKKNESARSRSHSRSFLCGPSCLSKWVQEGQVAPKESYFDFLDYKKIISIDPVLNKVFNLPGYDLSWCEKLDVMRRDPAHPEKPAPKVEDVEFFEKIKTMIISRIIKYIIKSPA